jgi:hypothetical protein
VRLSAALLDASPDSSAWTASVSGYLSGDGTGSFFIALGGGCAGVALGVGELFVVCCARTNTLPLRKKASIAATAKFVFILSLTELSTTSYP